MEKVVYNSEWNKKILPGNVKDIKNLKLFLCNMGWQSLKSQT